MSRRWLLVAAGAAALVGAVPLRDALPVAAGATPADDLRRRILGSAAQPWVGLAEATGRVALPELPALESTTALFTGVTRVRGHVAGPDRWRADELTPVGERDVYRLDGREYVWDFGFDQLTMLSGDAALRLPRAADLLPPELGRRLLRLAPDDPVTPLPARRIAGLRTEGLRLTPSDPDTTIGRIDVWADPVTGLPLHVEVAPRSDPGVPLLASAMQEVVLRAAGPHRARAAAAAGQQPGAGQGRGPGRSSARPRRPRPARAARRPPPGRADRRRSYRVSGSTGRDRRGSCSCPSAAGSPGGCSTGPPRRAGCRSTVPRGRAVRIGTPLLSLAVRGGRGGSVLLVGTVAPPVLERAVVELSGART